MGKNQLLILTIVGLFVLNMTLIGVMVIGKHDGPPVNVNVTQNNGPGHGPQDGHPRPEGRDGPEGEHMPDREHQGMNRGPKQFIINTLEFDEDQVFAYEILIEQQKTRVKQLELQMINLKKELYSSLSSESKVPEPKKAQLINQIGDLQKDIEKTNYFHFQEVRKICKPDQLEKFDEIVNKIYRLFERSKAYKPR